jgi:hypothetical protein
VMGVGFIAWCRLYYRGRQGLPLGSCVGSASLFAVIVTHIIFRAELNAAQASG